MKQNLRGEGIEEDEVFMAMREHGISDVTQVQTAVLETDGSISIVPTDGGVIKTRRQVRFLKHG